MSTIGDWTDLPTNYEDARYSGDRKFEMKKNTDNTVSLTDVTVYENEDVSRTFFGAAEANQINAGMNKLVGAVNDVINIMYPVGSIYMSVNSVNPSTLFGGTWERIQDRFLLCAGDSYGAGTTGGSAQATLPSHTHTVGSAAYQWWAAKRGKGSTEGGEKIPGSGKNYAAVLDDGTPETYKWIGSVDNTGETDVSQANMPPYLAVYVWKRTA